jgi:transcriptional regulator with XRE-family HTH domain
MAHKSLVDIKELGLAVHRRRRQQELSLRDLARETGISAATLSRIEHGAGKPDADNIARLARWLEMPLERIVRRSETDPKPVIYFPHESTPEIVEAHLRADRNLTPETAKALSELFRVAYTQFSLAGGPKSHDKRR